MMEWPLSKESNAMLMHEKEIVVTDKTTRGCLNPRLSSISVLLATLAGLSVFAGLMASLVVPKVFRSALERELVLVKGTAAFEEWSAPQSSQYTRFFFFSVLNPSQVLKEGVRPELKEMGPYTFMLKEQKTDVQFFPHNASVSYREKKFWFFVREESVGDLDDNVTTFNVPSYGGASMATGDFMVMALNSMLEGTEAFLTRSVGELLFDGYDDLLLSLADMMGHDLGYPADKFGWFYKRNGTTWGDGVFNMYTGEDNLDNLGRIHTWNGKDRTHFEGQCGDIKGSAGGFFPPGNPRLPPPSSVQIFSHDACRTFTFHKNDTDDHDHDHDHDHQEVEQIRVLAYHLDSSTFANASVNAANACFENNLPTGVQNNTRCKLETNSFLSFPHFFTADNFFGQQFSPQSIRPDASKHASRILIEPALGIPLEFLLRLQINMRLEPVSGITPFERLPKGMYLPIFWFEVEARVQSEVAQKLRLLLNAPDLINVVGKTLLGLSLIVAAIIIIRHVIHNTNNTNKL